ncbi:type II toxin-antitoxin system VapC family toxin [Thermococcus barossii]|uniref:type II toxin-antitoxin system VapC family toxin n=1 Tax=Thermococcus barossii TaxID=54077 RepID=UPI001E41E519|nr:type II toxin-antitoxin system VapC family toxin [Thermococcus barossii]
MKYLLKEEGWETVSEFLRKSGDLVSLEMALIEGANAVWKRYNLYKDISIETAQKILDYLHATKGIILYENPLQYLPEGEKIALEHKITVYDALYIAQALKCGRLATSDEKQGKQRKSSASRCSIFKAPRH